MLTRPTSPLPSVLTILSCSIVLGCGPKPPSNGETVADETTEGDVGGSEGDGDGDGDGSESGSDGSDESDGADASSTDTTESEDTDADTAEDGCQFEENPVGGFLPSEDLPESYCDPFAQDCLAGEKCVPYASSGGTWDANKCVPVMGSFVAGEACTAGPIDEGTDDCDATSLCWFGECTPFCEGTEARPICEPGSSCMITNQSSITLCLEGCDPLLQNCEDGLGCYWVGNSYQCANQGGLGEGEPCFWLNDCSEGLFCAPGEDVPGCTDFSCCTAFCDLDCPVCAAEGTECQPFPADMPPARRNTDVGICTTGGMG